MPRRPHPTASPKAHAGGRDEGRCDDLDIEVNSDEQTTSQTVLETDFARADAPSISSQPSSANSPWPTSPFGGQTVESPLGPYSVTVDAAGRQEGMGSNAASLDSGWQPATAHRPSPPVHQPKGRLLIGTTVVTVVGVALYAVWTSLLRYQAYGTVTGRAIHISAPWGGLIRGFHVREGDFVRQGAPLATLENLELSHRLAHVSDQLTLAQAEVDAEVSRLRWQTRVQGDHSQKALAEYYELWGTLLREQATLDDLQAKKSRQARLRQRGAITDEEWDSVHFAVEGQHAKVEKLSTAVLEMKKRVELGRPADDDAARQLQPFFARVESLQGELGRLRQQILQGEVRSPVDGQVTERLRFPGEHVDALQPIATVLEEGSLEAILYLSQRSGNHLQVGDQITLSVPPGMRTLTCRVLRVGDQLVTAPVNIRRYYRRDEKLLPVHLAPDQTDPGLPLNSEVMLPWSWNDRLRWLTSHGPSP